MNPTIRLAALVPLALAIAVSPGGIPADAVRGGEGAPPTGTWIAGDLHVHTFHSHDVCDPARPDSEQCEEEPWTAGFTPAQQIALAEQRGLGFVAITDHNTTAHVSDPGFRSDRILVIPGQELSLKGHANVIGYGAEIDRGDQSREAVQRIIEQAHAAGGLFQINHPAEPLWAYGRTPEEPEPVTGFDAIEIWNIHWVYQSRFLPFLDASDNPAALRYWESWLDRGVRVPGTGGSDSHWIASHPLNGVGAPSTWVFARRATEEGVLRGIRNGHVFVASEPPALGGARLFLEADDDGDGVYGTIAGEVLRGGPTERIRVRVENGAGNTIRLVTDGGRELATVPVTAPSQELTFTLDLTRSSWLRADLYVADPETAMTAISSPIYVRSKR